MAGKKEEIIALEQRLNKASAKLHRKHKTSHNAGNIAFRLLADLSAGLCVGFIIGHNLDLSLDTKPLFSSILIILGAAGGFYNFYKLEFKKGSPER